MARRRPWAPPHPRSARDGAQLLPALLPNRTNVATASGAFAVNLSRIRKFGIGRRARAACATTGIALLLLAAAMPPAWAAEIVVFAAASLKNALDEATGIYQKQSGDTVKISYAASSALARQIESGAPAQLFISADLDWMDYLQQRNLIQTPSRKNWLGNKLVLAGPADAAQTIEIKPGFDLAGALKGG